MRTIDDYRDNKKLCEMIKAVLDINPEAMCRIEPDRFPTSAGYVAVEIWGVAGPALNALWKELVPEYPVPDDLVGKVETVDYTAFTDRVPYGKSIDITDLGRCCM